MINYDFSQIDNKYSTIDTCSILNIISSDDFLLATKTAGFSFSYTSFVEYELFYRPCKFSADFISLQREKIKSETVKGFFRKEVLTIDDLQDISILEARKNLGKGELSSIAFAKKTGLDFTTDDIAARKLGEEILGNNKVMTTPRILGWLYFNRELLETSHPKIIEQHKSNFRSLSKIYEETFFEALRQRYSR